MNRLLPLAAIALLGGVLAAAQTSPASSTSDSSAKTTQATDASNAITPVNEKRSIHAPIVIFDLKTIETISGEVIEVVATSPKSAIRLQLKTDKETIAVQLGPESFLSRQVAQIKAHDQIEVRGSRVKLGGKPVIVAEQIKKGNQTLMLRDAKGAPAWKAAKKP